MSNEKNPNEENYFRSVREQLRYWPYTVHKIDDTLDVSLIEGRGRQLLFQAINAKNLTAFAGSGLSAAYGRLSWRDWETEQFSVVEVGSKAFQALHKTSFALSQELEKLVCETNTDQVPFTDQQLNFRASLHANDLLPRSDRDSIYRWLASRKRRLDTAWRQVDRLYQTFLRSRSDDGGFPGGEALPIKFQIAQQLHEELRKNIEIFMPSDDAIESRQDTFEKCWPGTRIDRESAPPVKALIVLKQCLENNPVKNVVEATKKFDVALMYYFDANSRKQARVSAQNLAKMLLIDERAHAMITLRSGLLPKKKPTDYTNEEMVKISNLENKLGIYSSEALKRNIDGIRENPEQFRVLSAFSFESFEKIQKDLKNRPNVNTERWGGLLDFTGDRIQKYLGEVKRAGDERRYLSPSFRFLMATYLCLHDDAWSLIGDLEPGAAQNENAHLLRPVERSSFTSRRSIIANRFDPLAKITRQLGISKYITTNYDLEIERFFQDQGYRKFVSLSKATSTSTEGVPADDEYRSDAIGGVLIDQGFERTQAGQLVAFALDSNSKDAAIYHLHGRAVQGDDLVITERDYMNLYLLSDKHRDTVNEGISMAFSSSPLIFLGLGMSEADLLRPLRQFMSNRDRTVGYHAVALLPAEKPIEERTKFAVTCYLRYGVHTVFYGSGQVVVTNSEDKAETTLGIDWLCRIMLLVEALHAELKVLGGKDSVNRGVTNSEVVLGRLAKAVSTISDDIEGYPSKTLAFLVLFGRIGNTKSSNPTDEEWQQCVRPFVEDICNRSLYLVDCQFTPIRPGPDTDNSRHNEDPTEVNVDSRPYVGFATDILYEVLLVVLDMHKKLVHSSSLDREIEAAKVTLNGLMGAFFTGCLNAQLTGIEQEWRSWWRNWQQSPPHRLPRFQRLPIFSYPQSEFGLSRFVRHRVDSVISNLSKLDTMVCEDYPFNSKNNERTDIKGKYKTRIRAFDSFVLSLYDSLPHNTISSSERLLITVAAHRGLGKGTFLSAMSTQLGLSLYSNATWSNPNRSDKDTSQAFLFSSAFINLSFSTEIASTYDMLVESLLELCSTIEAACEDVSNLGKTPDDVRVALKHTHDASQPLDKRSYYYKNPGCRAEKIYNDLQTRLYGVSRMRSLEILFSQFDSLSLRFSHIPTFGRPRFLVYLGGIELFFDSQGNPKNGEIEKFLDYLVGDATKGFPLDVIIVGSEAGLGRPFSLRKKQRVFSQYRLDRKNIPARGKEQISQRMLDGRLVIDKMSRASHREKYLKNESVREGDKASVKLKSARPVNYVHFARPFSPVSVLVDNFPVLTTALYIKNMIGAEANRESKEFEEVSEKIQKQFNMDVTEGRKESDRQADAHWKNIDIPNSELLDDTRKVVWSSVEAGAGRLIVEYVARGDTKTKQSDSVVKVLRDRLKVKGSSDREEWRSVRRYLGNNRFSTTILLAAAEHIVVHSAEPVEGGTEAEKFIRFTVDQVRNVGYEKREQLVLQIVIDLYGRFNVTGDPELDSQFHQLLLRHLGFIGSPIGAGVLVRLPDVRDYFTSLGDELDVTRRRFLARALTVLAYRGLIFRLDPHPRLATLAETNKHEDDTLWPARLEFRYALHRSVQRYAISKLGVGDSDPIRLNSFAPRLYTSMPSVGNGLSQEAYNFLRSLLVGLSQYPDVPQDDLSLRPWLFASSVTNVRVQALRAALSLARSTLSVATLSRFVDSNLVESDAQKLGLLETYKIRLRWIIRMAWEVVEPGEVIKANDNVKAELSHINALYRDEIVWLYNELGVVGISQGNFIEALGFLRQAAELNEDIEGRSRFGPMFDYIDLNHAIVQLERGRIRSATRRLRRICDKGKLAPELLRTIARGYLCVINHITGKNEGLVEEYESVTVSLQDLNDTRASAIFLSHWAQFMASIDSPGAIQQLQRAKALAETGGHEDVRHFIEVSRITAQYIHLKDGISLTKNTASPLKQLVDIEMYGKRMGIWSLQVDALKLRAELLLNQGETTTAGALVIRAMSIAKRNSMNLRLNSAITIYAKILHQRGDLKGAEVHALKSLEMAKSTRYSVETSRAQVVLSEIDPTTY